MNTAVSLFLKKKTHEHCCYVRLPNGLPGAGASLLLLDAQLAATTRANTETRTKNDGVLRASITRGLPRSTPIFCINWFLTLRSVNTLGITSLCVYIYALKLIDCKGSYNLVISLQYTYYFLNHFFWRNYGGQSGANLTFQYLPC